MATTAQPAPTLEITVAADIMDLHSDNGFDFGDGDIDLDLRSTGQQDDDLSLYDAGTDLGLDVQTASADQDDFMADNEDLIEEDEIDYEDDVVVDVDDHQSPAISVPDQQPTANAEDDLIDYSDEEEQPDWNDDSNTHNTVDAEATQNEPTGDETAEQTLAEEPYTAADPAGLEEPSHDYEYDVNHNPGEPDNAPTQTWNDGDDHGGESHADNNHDEYYADEHAASFEEQSNHLIEVTKNEHAQDQTEVKSDFHDGTALHDQTDRVSQECDLHPVTINYDSAELWLFKHHDYDSSGDYLVESHSLATKPISNLLEACRAALGSDVAEDMELGFRLDNFHNIELYQEHSSCAFVTLEHLVKLYLQLHTQDGISNPESFYMTLLFRPRVSALLSELNKAAAEGIGHTGLESAIAAGLTAFNIHLSHNSTEHIYEDWEGDEQQQNEESHDHEQVPSGEDEGHDEEHEQYGEDQEEDDEQQHEEHEEDHGEGNEEKNHGGKPTEPQVHIQDDIAHAPLTGSADNTTAQSDANPASQSPVEQLHSNAQTPHQADDIIDYSDDEADAEDDEAGENDAHEPPSSSATVQGDDPVSTQDGVQELVGQDNYTEDSGDAVHDNYEGEAGEHFAPHEDIDATYEGLDGIFGEEYNEDPEQVQEQEYAATHELEEYATEYPPQVDDGNTNQYDDFEEQDVDQTADFSLIGFADDSNDIVAQSTTVDGTFTGADDFLEFDNAVPATDVPVHDEVDYNDEDGAVGQAPVAASATADPVAASSSGLVELSPQGQKRTIDEVGNDVDEASDPSDAKRPRV